MIFVRRRDKSVICSKSGPKMTSSFPLMWLAEFLMIKANQVLIFYFTTIPHQVLFQDLYFSVSSFHFLILLVNIYAIFQFHNILNFHFHEVWIIYQSSILKWTTKAEVNNAIGECLIYSSQWNVTLILQKFCTKMLFCLTPNLLQY